MKTKKTKSIIIILSALSLVFCAVGAVSLSLALINDYDGVIGHFNFKSANANAAVISAVIGAVIAAVGFFTANKKAVFASEKSFSFGGTMASAFMGLMCLLYFGYLVSCKLPDEKQWLILAKTSLAALSSLYFFAKAFGVFSKKPAIAFSGLLPSLMYAFILLNLYFDKSYALNAPLKIYEIILLVTYMLFFTAESGTIIGRPGMTKKYIFAGLLAISVGGLVSIALLVSRISDASTFTQHIIEVLFYAASWVYIVVSFCEKAFTLAVSEEASSDADGNVAEEIKGSEEETEEASDESTEKSAEEAEEKEDADNTEEKEDKEEEKEEPSDKE